MQVELAHDPAVLRIYCWDVSQLINPSETFGDIVVDYPCVECTSACMTALHSFKKQFPDYKATAIAKAMDLGQAFVMRVQLPDGSWYGSWGVCFTYGAWFGYVFASDAYQDVHLLAKSCRRLQPHPQREGILRLTAAMLASSSVHMHVSW